MSKSGRWVPSPTAQGTPQPHTFFGRPSKAAASSPLAAQDASNQAYQQSNGQGPITASWSNPPANPNGTPNGTAQQGSNTGRMPSANVSAPLAAPQLQGRWQGFTRMFRPRPRRHGSGALLDHPDPAILSSIAESDPETGVVDASLHAYHSTDLDASNAAASASKLWAISAPSLSPRRGASASPGSNAQPGPSQGSYVVPSPWSTPSKQAQPSSASPTPGTYPVPSPQNTPQQTPPLSRVQTPSAAVAAVGPFEAAARARAAQTRASSSSPGDGNSQVSPAQAAYPVPSPPTANSSQPQPSSSGISPAVSTSSQSHSSPSKAGQAGPSPARDWSTGIAGMGTTRAARPSPSSTASRRRRL